jgi:hypothetical protein
MNPVALIAAATIVFPASPADGQTISIAFGEAITALTLTATGTTIRDTLTTASINNHAKWIYSSTSTTWFRIG